MKSASDKGDAYGRWDVPGEWHSFWRSGEDILIICSGVSGMPFHTIWVRWCAGRRAASKAETGWTPHGEPAQGSTVTQLKKSVGNVARRLDARKCLWCSRSRVQPQAREVEAIKTGAHARRFAVNVGTVDKPWAALDGPRNRQVAETKTPKIGHSKREPPKLEVAQKVLKKSICISQP